MIYLLDTNTISDLLALHQGVLKRLEICQQQGDAVALCRPVYFELLRGLLWRRANVKLTTLRNKLLPQLSWIVLLDEDWDQAAQFWANAVTRGKQLADTDCLLAAVAYRLNAVIATSDQDFNVLPIKCENWRTSQP